MDVQSKYDYHLNQSTFRSGFGFSLKVSPAEEKRMLAILQSYEGNTDYDIFLKNCTHPIQDAMAEIGINLDWMFSPPNLKSSLVDNDLIYQSEYYSDEGSGYVTVGDLEIE